MSRHGRLLLVRHGHTAASETRYLGWQDEPLDATGIRQAQRLSAALAGVHIDRVYSSPLKRAFDTARALAAGRRLTVAVTPALKEIDFGDCQGVSKRQQTMRLRHEHLSTPIPGGESLHDVYRRIEPIAAEFGEAMTRGLQLAAIGHYWSNRMLAAALRGIPFDAAFEHRDYKPRNASAVELGLEANGGDLRWLVRGGDDFDLLHDAAGRR